MNMKKFILFFLSLALLLILGCNGRHTTNNSQKFGDSIATIEGTSYYWLQLADDSAHINVVRDNKLITECLVTGSIYGAMQYEDGEIYILCGEDQLCWFDVRNIPAELNLLIE